MLLCQISDPHIVKEGTLAYGRIDTPSMLVRCVSKILALPRRPDAVVATGDLTDHAAAEEYAVLRKLLAPLAAEMPVYLAVGNHDDRDALRAAFPEHQYLAGHDGFIQYVVDDFPVRLVVLDTLIPGAPGGKLCAERLRWLDRTLAASRSADDRRAAPSALRHRHDHDGSDDTRQSGRRGGRDRQAPACRACDLRPLPPQHPGALCGTIASVCPSSAHQLLLDLVPDAGIRFTFEPSSFHLHFWNGHQLVTHTALVEDFPTWGSRG